MPAKVTFVIGLICVVKVGEQYVWHKGPNVVVKITSSVDAVQLPLVIDQRRVAEAPRANPVTPELGEEGVVMVAVPDTKVHVPVPVAGVFPTKVAVVTQAANVWSLPAFTVGKFGTLALALLSLFMVLLQIFGDAPLDSVLIVTVVDPGFANAVVVKVPVPAVFTVIVAVPDPEFVPDKVYDTEYVPVGNPPELEVIVTEAPFPAHKGAVIEVPLRL